MSDPIGYYEGAHRVTNGGVPCRVFIKRTREQAAMIATIETARDSGCGLELDDAPSFSFVPVDRGSSVYRSRGARPVPAAPVKSAFYGAKGAKRYIVGGVPCRMFRDKLNHSFAHWSDMSEPMGGFDRWEKRAREWWETSTERGRAERVARLERERIAMEAREQARLDRERQESQAREQKEGDAMAKRAQKIEARKAKRKAAKPAKPVLAPVTVPLAPLPKPRPSMPRKRSRLAPQAPLEGFPPRPDYVPADALGGVVAGLYSASP